MTVASQRNRYLDRPSSGGLAEVVDLILDKGLVIDIYVRVSLVGIELLTIDARIVIASVDTYLRFAEAVNRLDLARSGTETRGLPGIMEEIREGGAEHKTKGALEGVKGKAQELLHGGDEDEDEQPEDEEGEEGEEGKYEDEDEEGEEGKYEDEDEEGEYEPEEEDEEQLEPVEAKPRRTSSSARRKGRDR
ncbi:gas vesicle structural protein GvpA [Streptomyces sp. ActVer]|uniref:gas vesicle protein GvpJ n=1 Tax=Streptomyces sp. ActVer TaxID=3014558 RepID=UPI0022B527FE|nr:gas vesicle protein GvpJ [Streptomyces sp. ActVer]MCZ4507361.1 gas vesicle structural protein GvpA [Streptomyces sp. ActVer]